MQHVPYSGGCKKCIKMLIRKPKQKTKLPKPRYVWEDSIYYYYYYYYYYYLIEAIPLFM
jgi:hypothetical protein